VLISPKPIILYGLLLAQSFAKPVLSVRNVRMAATLFYRSIDFSSQ
jgi:hypothetical protein